MTPNSPQDRSSELLAAAEFRHRDRAGRIENPPRNQGRQFFLFLLGIAAFANACIMISQFLTPDQIGRSQPRFMERCREICREYGLVPTGNVANDAKTYVEAARATRLTESNQRYTDNPSQRWIVSQSHPLLGKASPEIQLLDHRRNVVSLTELRKSGPVVVVFYYGYGCSHCVAQLFALQKDRQMFRELGAEIVAISSDTPEFTKERFAEYGEFDFPVVSDPGNLVAEQWGVFIRQTEIQDEDRMHGTFLVSKSGTVIFANRGYRPFLQNEALLQWLSENRESEGLFQARNATDNAVNPE